jgi:flagellar biosynthesis/type III secretory pathway chaperone
MALPCPACKQPIGLTLEFIMRHPVTVCPHCEIIMDFTVNEEIKKSFTEAISEIDKIKKFNSKNKILWQESQTNSQDFQ